MKKTVSRSIMLVSLFALSSCTSNGYKSTWDCPKAKGVPCSSIEYADEIAREQIMLNTSRTSSKVLFKTDQLGAEEYQQLEVK